MGRELRRKEERKNKKIVARAPEELDTSIKKSTIFKLVIFTVLLLLVLYYIIAIFITKEIQIGSSNHSDSSEVDSNTGNSDRILATKTFEQKEEVYYVYYYDFNDYDQNIASAISRRSDLVIYLVDTSSALNKNFVTEDSGNRNVTDITNLKVKNPTMLQITNDTVTAYYEGATEIIKFLG